MSIKKFNYFTVLIKNINISINIIEILILFSLFCKFCFFFFTFRTLMLWGHHFSFHLILSGKWKTQYQDRLLDKALQLPAGTRFCIHPTPWEWEDQPEGYLLPEEIQNHRESLLNQPFIKLSYFFPLRNWELLVDTGLHIWEQWASFVFRP